MLPLLLDIVDGTDIKDFLEELYSDGFINAMSIKTIFKKTPNSGDYFIEEYSSDGGRKITVSLSDLSIEDIENLLAGKKVKKSGYEIDPEDMIFKHKP